MAKKPIRILSLSALAVLLLSSPLWLGPLLSTVWPRPAPIIIRYVEGPDAGGRPSDQLSLWVSNRTDLPLMVCLSGVEVWAGSTWTNCSQRQGLLGLRFCEEVGKPAALIGPHQAEETLGFYQPLPQEGLWRVKAVALARVSRTQKLRQEFVFLLESLRLIQVRRIDTNLVPLITLSGGRRQVEFYKPVCEVVSEEARAQPAGALPKASSVAARGFSSANPEAIARAHAALEQKFKELDETATTPSAAPLK